MIVVASIIAGTAVGMTVVVAQLCKAPIGYEDATGFHIIQRIKCSAVRRYGKPKQAITAALEGAEIR